MQMGSHHDSVFYYAVYVAIHLLDQLIGREEVTEQSEVQSTQPTSMMDTAQLVKEAAAIVRIFLFRRCQA